MKTNLKRNLAQNCLLTMALLALPVAVHAQFTYITNNGAINITGYTGSGGAVSIPATINGLPVTSVGDFAFYDCEGLTSVTIPNSVTSIGYEAFGACSILTIVYFDGNAPGADPGAFSWIYADSLHFPHQFYDPATIYYLSCATGWSNTFAVLPTVMLEAPPQFGTTADGWSYWGYVSNQVQNTLITGYAGSNGAAVIPSTINGLPVTGIEPYAFWNNSNLTSVVIPDSVTSIGDEVFQGCTNLTSAVIGNGVTRIGDGAFADTALTSVMIPNSVTSIGGIAFALCNSLTSVTIGNGITSIGDYAFEDCYILTSVYFNGNAPNAGSYVFFGYDSDDPTTVYYLPGTLGWGSTFPGGDTFPSVPTALWFLPNPLILTKGPGFGVQSNQFGFTISWATNVPVVVEACTNLSNPVWLPVSTNTLVGGTSYFSDPQPANLPGRFYRLRSP